MNVRQTMKRDHVTYDGGTPTLTYEALLEAVCAHLNSWQIDYDRDCKPVYPEDVEGILVRNWDGSPATLVDPDMATITIRPK